jgi:type IV pilus assembly protein PilZ
MSTSIPRREKRFAYALPIRLSWRSERREATTKDVSVDGMFLPTPLPIELRHMVRLDMDLPGEEVRVSSRAMVVHVARDEGTDQTTQGVGVQFFDMGTDEREAWDRFMEMVKREASGSDPGWDVRIRPPRPRPERRQFGRFAAILQVKAENLGELVTMYTRDVSKGGMFLKTDLDLAVGDLLALQIVHPDTFEIFSMRGMVRRIVQEGDSLGVGVQFVGMSETRREEFWRFVSDYLVDDPNEITIDVLDE